jgi:RNA-directed DNA polymerase
MDAEKLKRYGLPVLGSEAELADWLGIHLSRLRWFTTDKPVDHTWHYVRYQVAKRRGGQRVILAPKRELKALQRKIYHDLLSKLPLHSAAHGFVAARSIITNAKPHVGKAVILNLDLQDFFPNISYRRVRGLFLSLGYSLSVSSTFALLCTERDRRPLQRGGQTVYVSNGERTLVQGAPTSPTLANLIARRLDARLDGMARKLGLTYTRYADDLTFSGDDYGKIFAALELAKEIITAEAFLVHEEKTCISRQSNRQIVTGIVVNQGTNTPRKVRRRVRAILNNAAKTGLAAQNHQGYTDFRAYLLGLIGYIHEGNPAHARPLLEKLRSVED